MHSLRPTYIARNIEALSPEVASEYALQTITFDVDGTLSDYHAPEAEASVIDTLTELGQAGLTLFIISNAYGHRVTQLVDTYGEVIPETHILTPASVADEGEKLSLYRKPNPAMLQRAMALSAAAPEHTLMVGDQLFRDVASANRAGTKSLLVPRRGTSDHLGVRLQRVPEMATRAALQLPVQANRFRNTFPDAVAEVR